MSQSSEVIVECPMCGKYHRLRRSTSDTTIDDTELFNFGRSTLENSVQAGKTATKVFNKGLDLAGFSETGIKKGSLASSLQRNSGNISKGSVFSKAQSAGAKGGASNTSAIAIGVTTAVAAITAVKFAYDKWKEYKQSQDEDETEGEKKRKELNLCEACWRMYYQE